MRIGGGGRVGVGVTAGSAVESVVGVFIPGVCVGAGVELLWTMLVVLTVTCPLPLIWAPVLMCWVTVAGGAMGAAVVVGVGVVMEAAVVVDAAVGVGVRVDIGGAVVAGVAVAAIELLLVLLLVVFIGFEAVVGAVRPGILEILCPVLEEYGLVICLVFPLLLSHCRPCWLSPEA